MMAINPKWLWLLAVGLLIPSSTLSQVKPLNAREYYDELYKAGGLDNFADKYVCFREDAEPVFILMSDSAAMKDFLLSDERLKKKLSPEMRKSLEKGFLIVRAYRKGIAQEREFFDPDNHGNWIEYLMGGPNQSLKKVIVRLEVNWSTLRYTRLVSTPGLDVPYSESGKCESVKSDIRQHGAPEAQESK